MTTSGTFSNNFDNADFVTEAFERIGVDPIGITSRHIDSALRSIEFMFAEWETRGVRLYKLETITLTSATTPAFGNGIRSLTLPTRVIRVINAVSQDADGAVVPIAEIGRQDYDWLNNKTQTGSIVDRFYLDRQRDAPVLYNWPVPDNNLRSLVLSCFVRMQDVGELSDQPDVPRIWFNALAQGLSGRLAQKYNRPIMDEEMQLGEIAFKLAKGEDRDPAPTQLVADLRIGRRR